MHVCVLRNAYVWVGACECVCIYVCVCVCVWEGGRDAHGVCVLGRQMDVHVCMCVCVCVCARVHTQIFSKMWWNH